MAVFWQDLGKIVGIDLTDKMLVGRNSDGETVYADVQQLYDILSKTQFADVKPSVISAGANLGSPSSLTVYYAPAGSYTTASGTITLTENFNLLFWDFTGWSALSYTIAVKDNSVTTNKILDAAVTTLKIADSAVTNQKISAQSVSFEKTNFIQIGKNIFNKNQTFLLNSQINNTTGAIITDVSFSSFISDYIEVTGGTTLATTVGGYRVVNEYTAKNEGSRIRTNATFNSANNLTLQSTTKYIRVSCIAGDKDVLQIEKGTSPTAYEEFCYVLKTTDGLTKIQADTLASTLFATILSYVVSNLPDSSISDIKTTLFETGKNIFDKSQTLTASSQISSTTGLIAEGTNRVTGFIPVLPSTAYIVNAGGNRPLAQYDANKNFISGTKVNATSASAITMQAGTRYIRIELPDIQDINLFQVEAGTSVTAYETYRYSLKDKYLTLFAKKTDLPDLTALTAQIAGLIAPTAGKNIFDKSQTLTASSQISSTTGLIAGGTNRVTGFIPVISGATYCNNSFGTRNIAEYDTNKVFITGSKRGMYIGNNLTMGSTTKFIRVELPDIQDINVFQIERVIAPNTGYTEYQTYRLESPYPISTIDARNSVAGLSNRFALPSKQYLLRNYTNSIYLGACLRRFNSNFFTARIWAGNVNITNVKFYDTRTTIVPDVSQTLVAELYDADFNLLEQKNITTVVGDATTNNGAVKIIAMGDSYTAPLIWAKRVVDVCPAITFMGINRGHPSIPSTILGEGRSGWKLADYFSTSKLYTNEAYFTPFLQPIDPYKYYGSTNTWKNALASTDVNYVLKDTALRIGFNASTGLKTSPANNDVMYVNADSTYKRYDSATSSWIAITQTELGFTFSFAKYRAVWQIDQPNFFNFMLGINDFASLTPKEFNSTYITYKNNLDTVIASVKADTPTVKFVIMLPTTYFPTFAESEGNMLKMKNYLMFLQREALIRDYDNRESEGIYLLDAASSIDPEFGFAVSTELPFQEYVRTGDGDDDHYDGDYEDRVRQIITDPIHPQNGYYQIGTRAAALFQALR